MLHERRLRPKREEGACSAYYRKKKDGDDKVLAHAQSVKKHLLGIFSGCGVCARSPASNRQWLPGKAHCRGEQKS